MKWPKVSDIHSNVVANVPAVAGRAQHPVRTARAETVELRDDSPFYGDR